MNDTQAQALKLIAAGQRNYIATRDERGIVITQVVPYGDKLLPVGPELTGKVMGRG